VDADVLTTTSEQTAEQAGEQTADETAPTGLVRVDAPELSTFAPPAVAAAEPAPPTALEPLQEPEPAAAEEATGTLTVSQDDLVVLARVASKAKVARDSIQDRDEKIAEAVTDDGVEVTAVAYAAGLTPAEVAEIVFAQESNPSPFTQLRRSIRRRHR
jgi:hypothetical protein